MTTYTFKPDASKPNVNWGDSTTWVGGVVPNSNNADVIIDTATDPSSGNTFYSTIYVGSGFYSYVLNSLSIDNNYLYLGQTFSYNPVLTSNKITVGSGASIKGSGTISSSIENDGLIEPDNGTSELAGRILIDGQVYGSGQLMVGLSTITGYGRGGYAYHYSSNLELNGSVSEGVGFADQYGVLTLDQPGAFSGTITPLVGDQIVLNGIALSSVTSTSYSGDASGGTLTINESGTSVELKFVGEFNSSSFVLATGPQQLSSSPPSLQITIVQGAPLASRADVHDFNGDGRSDLMWQDRSSGALYEWAMNGTQAGAGSGYVASLDPATWQPLSAGDFNGDSKADLLWQDTSGNLIDWTMDGTQVTSGAYVGTMPGSQYGLLATDDFGGDGKADLLWQDKSSGALSLWDMNGAQVSGGGYVANMDASTWQLAAHGDFSGDGKADLLWENRSTGDLYLWDMNDQTVTGSAYVGTMSPSQWTLAASGDFNGDGKTDLLWQDKGTGNLFSWDMNNGQVSGGSYVATMDPSQWQLAGTGDFTGDGKTDLLWQDTSSNLQEWTMNDAQVSSGGYVGTMPQTQWTLASH